MTDPVTAALAVTSIVLFGTTMVSTGIAIGRWNLGESVRNVPVMIERLERLKTDVREVSDSLSTLTNQLAKAGVFNRRHNEEDDS